MPQVYFQERLLCGHPLLLDGPIGTELARRGVSIDGPAWSAAALLTDLDAIRAIHRDYVACGAELLTANTFRTHARSLERIGRSRQAGEMTRLAVEIARGEAGETTYVAGSQAPLEDCYRADLTPSDRDLRREHQQMAEHLASAGVDVILAEAHPTMREAVAVAQAARAVGMPVMVSFVCGRDGRLLSGESLIVAAEAALAYDPLAIMVNCVPAEAAASAVNELLSVAGRTPVGVYANVGWSDDEGRWTNTDSLQPAVYADQAATWLSSGARLVGGCCGTTPGHIAALRRLIDVAHGSAAHSDD